MGNWESGDRGLAAVSGREQEFRDSLPRVLEYAAALDCIAWVVSTPPSSLFHFPRQSTA